MVIIAPLLLTLMFAAIQAGIWFYARNLALTAAQQSTHQARGTNGSVTTGQQAAESYLQRTSSGILSDVTITVTSDGDTVTTTVTGTSLSLIPGVAIEVSQSSVAPVEKIYS